MKYNKTQFKKVWSNPRNYPKNIFVFSAAIIVVFLLISAQYIVDFCANVSNNAYCALGDWANNISDWAAKYVKGLK